MSKIVGTLFLVIVVAIFGGIAVLSFMDVPVEQNTVSESVTLDEFRSNSQL